MLVSLDFIKDFADIGSLSPEEILKKVTLSICEVEGMEVKGECFDKILIAEIKSLKKHPEADKLNLVTFDYGQGDFKEVVCGAPNVRIGLKVPYARLGLTLPNGMTLEPKKIRGYLSEGMLCSRMELGLGEDHDGLMELRSDAKVGGTLLEYLGEEKDIVFDIDNKSLTHRPDLWGIYGLSREFATVFGKELKNPFDRKFEEKIEAKFTKDKSPIVPRLDGESSCLGYFGLTMEGIKVTESSDKIKSRLLKAGLRPINNIVDISNYVMLELGIPNHIFDASLIKDEIILKRVGAETSFITLDEVERHLIPSDTVVADSTGPLVLAGIMGGLKSGVKDDTNKIFIEVANWKAGEVRKTSTRIGLRTDSSQRYEKSLDTMLLKRTLYRLVELLLESCPNAKIVGKPEYAGINLNEFKPLVIKTSIKSINSQLGVDIEENRILGLFKALDFKVSGKGPDLEIEVPSYRSTKDVECEADLVEEIGRMIGYDNIKPISPKWGLEAVELTPAKKLQRKIQDFFMMRGRFLEIYSYPLMGKTLIEKAKWGNDNEDLKIINALSIDHDRPRPSLVPSLLEAAAINQKNYDQFRFFEIGKSFASDKKEFSVEKNQLGIVIYDKDKSQFMEMVNIVQDLFSYCQVPAELMNTNGENKKFPNATLPTEWWGIHPIEHYEFRIMGRMGGGITTVHPLALRNFKMKGYLTIAVIDLSLFENKENKEKFTFKPISKFPHSVFDLTVVAKEDDKVLDVLLPLKKLKMNELRDVKVVTVFPMPEQKSKAVTLRVTFADDTKTLDSAFIKDAEEKVISTLKGFNFPLKS